MLKLRMLTPILTLAITTSAWAADPLDAWDLLETAEVREEGEDEQWRAVKTFPQPLRDAAAEFTIEGYTVPVMAQAYIDQFMLVPDPANCPFCGNGGYGPVLEVVMKRALPDMPEFSRVTLTGTLEFNESDDSFQMFRLVDARLIEMSETGFLPPVAEDG